jgi:hypothetical protein
VGFLLLQVPYLCNMMRYPYSARVLLESITNESHAEVRVLCKVLGNLRAIYKKMVRVLLLNQFVYVTQILIRCSVHVLTPQNYKSPFRFNMCLVNITGITVLIL